MHISVIVILYWLSFVVSLSHILIFNGWDFNSAILRRSCYKEVTFYLTINVFWSQQHIVQRKSFIVCMLVKFAGIIYKERLPGTRKRFIPQNSAI